MNINATLIGQTISFAFFVWFCMTYVWPPLMKALNDRQKKIADGLAAAEKAQHDLKLADKKATIRLQEVRAQAQEVIDQANKRATQIIDEAKLKAKEESARLKAAADAEIDQEVNRARHTLRSQVATLAVFGAEKILGQQLDKTANARLVDDLASQL
ncbi:MAG: F0F1 ATP synthase subunit B [Candidatus Endonucleobacter bathymodioli]|uniref:ATP synthase subunit b n=1 Tax=Candidatus Endonucleibacter bathymodioli TaxID=539814 RepID=A0AA90SWR8_9GAMM|nr:F0F1 ATP synthase subunit B [Candidatus Endonucleobacter bathymodioli]